MGVKIPPEEIEKIRGLYESGLTIADIMKVTGKSEIAVRKICDKDYITPYQFYKDKGICWKCKQKDAIKGGVLCEECLASERERQSIMKMDKSEWELELDKIQATLNELIRLLKSMPIEKEEKLIYSKLITYYKKKVVTLKTLIKEVNQKWH